MSIPIAAPGPGVRSAGLPQAGIPAEAPPLSTVMLHYAASLTWLCVAAPVLYPVGDRLLRNMTFDPMVIAFVHMIMLGVVGSAIFGTLLQFIPVGLGVPLHDARLGLLGFVLYELGVATMIAGFWWWIGWLQALGWLIIFGAIGAHAQNTLHARRRTVNGKIVGAFITISHGFFGFAMAVAAARIGETLGFWHIDRLYLLAAHALFGAVGFGTLTAIGIGSRMLPTFLNAPGNDGRWLSNQLLIASVGLLVFGVGAILTQHWIIRIGAFTVLVAGVISSLILARWFRRRQRSLDSSLRHLVVAATALSTAVVMGMIIFAVSPLALNRWAAIMVVLLLGWLTTLVMGVMSKILPHVLYLNLALSRPRLLAIGTPNRLLKAWLLGLASVAFAFGWTFFAFGLWFQQPVAVWIGAISWSIATVSTAINYLNVLRLSLFR